MLDGALFAGFAILALLPAGLLPDRPSFALFLVGLALWMIGRHLPRARSK